MGRPKVKPSESALDKMLGEASWLLSHAEALADYGRKEEALAELARAAGCEEQVACWLNAAGREKEAGVFATLSSLLRKPPSRQRGFVL